jgi:hypothetical protein
MPRSPHYEFTDAILPLGGRYWVRLACGGEVSARDPRVGHTQAVVSMARAIAPGVGIMKAPARVPR